MNNRTEQVYIINTIQTQPAISIQKQATVTATATHNLENVEDLSNVCRTCATITQLVVPIFAGEGLEHHLADKIHKHLPITVLESDDLPLVMCYQCVSTLLAWHELVECCLQADRALRAKISIATSNEDAKVVYHTTTEASNNKTEEDSQNKLDNNTEYVQPAEKQQTRDPPKYTPPGQLCEFCNTPHSEDSYIRHLLVEHSHLNRRLFITQLSQHASIEQQRTMVQLEQVNWESYLMANNSILLTLPNAYAITPVIRNEDTTTVKLETPRKNANVSVPMTSLDNSNKSPTVTRNQDSNEKSSAKPNKIQQNSIVTTSTTSDENINAAAKIEAKANTNSSRKPDEIANVPTQVKRALRSDALPRRQYTNTTPITVKPDTKMVGQSEKTTETNKGKERSDHSDMDNSMILKPGTKSTEQTDKATRDNQDSEFAVSIGAINYTATITMKPDTESAELSDRITKNDQDNEFSDHSDMESEFDPLPQSVFEAIEDTQDGQPAGTSNPIANNEINDEGNPTLDTDLKNTSSKKTRACPICSKVYKAASSYFYHLKHTHKKIKEHECNICSRKFATQASLAAHTPIHTGECRFQCKECKKRFMSKASLYIHEQIHKGIKTFSCEDCNTSFRWKTHLFRHMKRHAAEKTNVCSICGRGFSIRSDMLRHVQTHTAGDFPCTKCDIKFAQLRYLKAHMVRKHGVV